MGVLPGLQRCVGSTRLMAFKQAEGRRQRIRLERRLLGHDLATTRQSQQHYGQTTDGCELRTGHRPNSFAEKKLPHYAEIYRTEIYRTWAGRASRIGTIRPGSKILDGRTGSR